MCYFLSCLNYHQFSHVNCVFFIFYKEKINNERIFEDIKKAEFKLAFHLLFISLLMFYYEINIS